MMHLGDCLPWLRSLPANSVDLILTDPPYFKVKSEAWDRQWDKPAEFLAWLGTIADEWRRVLKPNGSLYCFASPQMSARVEVMLGSRFAILNSIVWNKSDSAGRHSASCKEDLRSFFPATERIVFAEQLGADNMAKGEAGYEAKCDELRGFVFEPLRRYLCDERDRCGITNGEINKAFQAKTGNPKSGMAGHWFSRVQWCLPTEANYLWLRELFTARGAPEPLRREYEDLRREYEDLRREYEDLRRPFSVTKDDFYTDVWSFKTVQAYRGKHPCEKPQALLRHMIERSTRPGGVVLDCFAGSGSTGVAALALGREFMGCEMSPEWHAVASRALAGVGETVSLPLEAAQ